MGMAQTQYWLAARANFTIVLSTLPCTNQFWLSTHQIIQVLSFPPEVSFAISPFTQLCVCYKWISSHDNGRQRGRQLDAECTYCSGSTNLPEEAKRTHTVGLPLQPVATGTWQDLANNSECPAVCCDAG